MRDLSHVGVTTTSSLEGWEISEYLGPVIAHAVAGTGLFSDIFAGLSDFFGGRSGSYQNQLNSLSEEVVGRLRRQAADRRGNWVVGLSIDMDEISGKDKSMFMVTATGTAVLASRRAQRDGLPVDAPEGRLTTSVVQSARARFALEEAIAARTVELNDANWETAITEGVVAMLAPALRSLSTLLKDAYSHADAITTLQERIRMLLDRLGEPVAIEALYRNAQRVDTAAGAIQVIIQHKRRDLTRVLEGLKQADVSTRRRVVQTLRAEQQNYGPSDIALLEEIATIIADPATFPSTGRELAGKPGLFGAGPRIECECGGLSPRGDPVCNSCNRDWQGFTYTQLKPQTAVEAALAEAALLRRIFAGEVAATAG
jgi:uncharacterized protein YbjQ (UPF0145 family)